MRKQHGVRQAIESVTKAPIISVARAGGFDILACEGRAIRHREHQTAVLDLCLSCGRVRKYDLGSSNISAPRHLK